MDAILNSKWTGWLVFFCIAVACGKEAFTVWVLSFFGYLCYRAVRGFARAVRRVAEYRPAPPGEPPAGRPISDAEWGRIKERAAATERGESEAQRRREEARARVETAYALHAPELGERLSWGYVSDFMDRYINDHQSPESAERRAQQLIDVIQQHLRKVDPPRRDEPGAARGEAERYYESHPELRDVYPPELFNAFVRREMADHVDPDDRWEACQTLLKHLRDLVLKAKKRREKEEQTRTDRARRLRQIDEEIRECEVQIERERGGTEGDPDARADEIAALEGTIERLKQDRKLLSTLTD